MKNLAALFDLAINAEGFDKNEFAKKFAQSDIASGIENGVPDILAGKSATELLIEITGRDSEYTNIPTDRTPEYWLGWSLSYYQWVKNFSFKQITDVTDIDELLLMYKKYHEMDIEHFVIELDIRRKNVFSEWA